MRSVSRRFRALIGHPNRWTNTVEWSNDGGTSWTPATLVTGTVTADATNQIRWSSTLTLVDVEAGPDQINPFSTQMRILHGIVGERLLPMGRYTVDSVTTGDDGTVQVGLSSREAYLIASRFVSSRTFPAQSAKQLAQTLIAEVLPGALLDWRVTDIDLPKIVEPRDRWPLIDGDRDATSIAKAAGARIYTDPTGQWIAAPVPSLADPTSWEATEGEGGVLLESAEQLTNDGVFNVQVVTGESGQGAAFKPGIAQDLDPLSPTYVKRPVDQGGFGVRPRFYTSSLVTSSAQAQTAAQAQLASFLGLRQQVSFTQLHDPTLEPGDVGIVHTRRGPRRVIVDAVTYDLTGQPLSIQTRTTATRLAGDVVDAAEDQGE